MKFQFYLLLALAFSACTKDAPAPTVSFNATEVTEGSVNFNATSSDAESYLWDFGDGYSTEVTAPSHFYTYNGTYVVTLTAKGKGGETTVKKDVVVKSILGEVMFWMRHKGEANVLVSIDGGGYFGNIDGVFASEPECLSGGAVTYLKLFDGEHSYHAKEEGGTSSKEWSGKVTVVGRKCLKKELVY